MPDYLMNGTAKSEIQEALTWSLNRRELLNRGISALGALIEDGFPSRLQQVAPEDIVQVFLDRLANLTAAVGEFTTLTATLTNDGEHPVVE